MRQAASLKEHLAWVEEVRQLKREVQELCRERKAFHKEHIAPLNRELLPLKGRYIILSQKIEHRRRRIYELIE